MLQMPFYNLDQGGWQSTQFCGLASIADTLMVLLIYNAFAFATKDAKWIFAPSYGKILLLMAIGSIGAILAEHRHLIAASWSYTEIMPIIPLVNVGLVPVLQFLLLPGIIFRLTVYFLKLDF